MHNLLGESFLNSVYISIAHFHLLCYNQIVEAPKRSAINKEVSIMKKLLAFLLSVCMVSAFAVPAFADANSDYIAAVKAYQAQVAAKEAAYTAAVQAAAQQAQAKADAECLAVIAAGKAAQAKADAEVAAVIAAGKATQAAADRREAAYATAVKNYQAQIAAKEAAYIAAVLGQ